MSVRMRHTRSHTGNRRAHHALGKPSITKNESGNLALRHRVSPIDGTYKGKEVIDVKKRVEKKLAKKTEIKKQKTESAEVKENK
jgi:ribosomal protein L32